MADARLIDWLKTEGLQPSVERLQALDAFEERLYEFNRVMNLTRVPREDFWVRHVVDSLLIQSLIPAGAKVLDIGSGPGFPAWPIACFRSDLQVTALDASNKAVRFLDGVPLENLEVMQGRAEGWGVREAFDFVTGRALASLAIQLELSAGPCRLGGTVAPMRTPSDEPEFGRAVFEKLGLVIDGIERRTLPEFGAIRVFPVYRKGEQTPREFPRTWAAIKKELL